MAYDDHYRIHEFREDQLIGAPPRKRLITSKRFGFGALAVFTVFTCLQGRSNHPTPATPIKMLSSIPEKVTRENIENAGLLIFPLKGDQCGLLLKKRPGEKEVVLLFGKPPGRENEECLAFDQGARRAFKAQLRSSREDRK